MTVTLKSFIIAFFLLIFSIAIYRYAEMQKQPSVNDISKLPTFTAENFNGQIYDELGLIKHDMQAKNVEYYSKKKLLKLDTPLVTSYNYNQNNQAESWYLSGDKGEIIFDQQAIVTGNVKLYPGFNHPNLKIINANKLIYNFADDTVTSKDKVTITGHNFVNSGTNFVADLRNNTMSYKGAPHVIYYPQNN